MATIFKFAFLRHNNILRYLKFNSEILNMDNQDWKTVVVKKKSNHVNNNNNKSKKKTLI